MRKAGYNMKLTVQKENLLKGLQKVSNIIGSRSTLPVLANVLLEADGETLTLTTTDLEVRISTKVEAKVESGGKTTIPAKKLLSLVSKFIEETVTMDCGPNHHTEIVCGSAKSLNATRSISGCSVAIRAIWRPMRPNPLMPNLMPILLLRYAVIQRLLNYCSLKLKR